MEMAKMPAMGNSSTSWGSKNSGSKPGGREGKKLPINQSSGVKTGGGGKRG